MNKYNLLFLIFIFILILSCNNRNEKETKSFQEYLTSNFKKQIPEEQHIYLLISRFNCAGCVQKIFFEISGKLKNKEIHSITILTYDLNLVPENLKNKITVLLDENAQYENIGLSIANVALIKTNKRKINSIQIINLNKITTIVNNEFGN